MNTRPSHGEIYRFRYFAWFPKKVQGRWIWLKHYYQLERFKLLEAEMRMLMPGFGYWENAETGKYLRIER